MALGKTYNNNKKELHTTTFSALKMYNKDGVDPTAMTFTFWNNLLKLSIAPKKESTGDYAQYDYENAGLVYLSPMKAKIFADSITAVLEDPSVLNDSIGVPSSNGIISLHKSVNGSKGMCIVIKKLDEHGRIEASYAYEFKVDFNFAVKDYTDGEDDIVKVYNNNLELLSFRDLLQEFYLKSNGASAHFNREYSKFDKASIDNKLVALADKLGVEYGKGGYKKSSSIFSSNKSSNDTPAIESGESKYSIDNL